MKINLFFEEVIKNVQQYYITCKKNFFIFYNYFLIYYPRISIIKIEIEINSNLFD